MKTLLSLVITLATCAAMADIPRPTPKPKPADAKPELTLITEGSHEIKLLLPKCATDPVKRCAAMPSVAVHLGLSLIGCADTAHITYSTYANPNNNDVKVVVSALNVGNPKSKVTRCAAPPTASADLVIGGPSMQHKNITVEFLQNNSGYAK